MNKIKKLELIQTINRSANYLAKMIKTNGSYIYRINMNSKIKLKKSYNLLRHAGSIYSLCQYNELYPSSDLEKKISNSGNFLRYNHLSPLPKGYDKLAIWSTSANKDDKVKVEAKLGGSGLALVAFTYINKFFTDFISISELRKIGRFIVHMQKDDGSFFSKYIPEEGGKQDSWTSLYYPGEAALGQLMLFEIDSDDTWFNSANAALSYLALSRQNQVDVPADHWALLATEKLIEINNKNKIKFPTKKFTDHAIQICNKIISEQIVYHNKKEFIGGFVNDGRITPTATRLEGLIATASYIPENHDFSKNLLNSINLGISFLINAQIKKGEYTGAFPCAISKKLPLDDFKNKIFNRRATEIRIDYIQHALSALMQYLKQNFTTNELS